MDVDQKVQVKVFQQTKSGETYCGDSYFYIETEDGFFCVLADGLGSGTYAKESSQVVINTIKNNISLSEKQLIRKCIQQLQGKRGVVLGILKLDFAASTYTYSSIGNIGFITKNAQEKKKNHIPRHGYLSSYERPLKRVNGKLKPDTILILYSDGISYTTLSKSLTSVTNIQDWLVSFPIEQIKKSQDDTTVIAMYYKGRD